MNDVDIPRFVDSQSQYLWWEMDEFIILFSTACVGLLFDEFLKFIVLAFLVVRGFQRFKHNSLEGIMLHIGYWLGFAPLNSVYTDSGQRDFFF